MRLTLPLWEKSKAAFSADIIKDAADEKKSTEGIQIQKRQGRACQRVCRDVDQRWNEKRKGRSKVNTKER